MSVLVERLDGGLVSARDASMLLPGELAAADDAFYHIGDSRIWKVPGRTKFNATPEGSTISGLAFIEFENDERDLLALVGTVLRIATAADTGTFADLVTGLTGGGTYLSASQYRNRWYVGDGINAGRAIHPGSITYRHGYPVETIAPTVASTGSGTGFTLGSGRTVRYWTERITKDSAGVVVKRSASQTASVATLTGTGALVKPVVTKPVAFDGSDGSTHWAAYATATNGSFPSGAQIGTGEVAIAVGTIEDTRTGTDPSLPSGTVYEILSITVDGLTTLHAKNGPPVPFSTSTVFEDSLLTNDPSGDKTAVLYSAFDAPHSFPIHPGGVIRPNQILFEKALQGPVTMLRSLGQVALVGLRDGLWRVNTLPRPGDGNIQTERVKAEVEGAYGPVGPGANALFGFKGRLQCAYTSRYGIVATDGYEWDTLTDDIDWEGTVEVAQLEKSRLIYFPRHFLLAFYYPPVGSTTNTRALYFHVHPTQIKTTQAGPRPKITGPIAVSASNVARAFVRSTWKLYTTNGATVYLEFNGDSDAAGTGIAFRARTREILPARVGGYTRISGVRVRHTAAPNRTADVSIIPRIEGQTTNPQAARSVALDREEATTSGPASGGESFQVEVANSDALGTVGLGYVALKLEESVESRRS